MPIGNDVLLQNVSIFDTGTARPTACRKITAQFRHLRPTPNTCPTPNLVRHSPILSPNFLHFLPPETRKIFSLQGSRRPNFEAVLLHLIVFFPLVYLFLLRIALSERELTHMGMLLASSPNVFFSTIRSFHSFIRAMDILCGSPLGRCGFRRLEHCCCAAHSSCDCEFLGISIIFTEILLFG